MTTEVKAKSNASCFFSVCSLSPWERVGVRAPDRTIQSPLPYGERARVRGNMWLCCRFRSPHVYCSSVTPAPVNVQRGLAAAPFAIPAPGKKIAASRFPQLIPSGYRVGHQPASLQAMPSRRIPAPRPGLRSTLRRFSAGQGRRCGCMTFFSHFIAVEM